jgi:ABC-type uncharacterized transport system substrate-binding protein
MALEWDASQNQPELSSSAADSVELVVESPPPVITPPMPPEPEALPQLRATVIVSADLPAFSAVADALVERLGSDNIDLLHLNGRQAAIAQIQTELRDRDRHPIIAIGLLAALASKPIDAVPVYYCQVFNFEAQGLDSAGMHGISPLPSSSQTLASWRKLQPQLASIGVVTGGGHNDLLGESFDAAAQLGIEIIHRRVSSDREAIYEGRALLENDAVDGLWLFPDNRIHSAESIRELLALSREHRRSILVNNSQLLEAGALLLATTRPDEIAAALEEALMEAQRGDSSDEDRRLRRVRGVDILVNSDAAARLGIEVPDEFRQMRQAR